MIYKLLSQIKNDGPNYRNADSWSEIGNDNN